MREEMLEFGNAAKKLFRNVASRGGKVPCDQIIPGFYVSNAVQVSAQLNFNYETYRINTRHFAWGNVHFI